MIKADEPSLICDFAETYHVLNYRELPALLAATLAAGLRDDARIRMKLGGCIASTETLLLASIVDRLSLLLWSKTRDAEKGRNKPKQLVDSLIVKKRTVDAFYSGKDFEAYRRKLIEGM